MDLILGIREKLKEYRMSPKRILLIAFLDKG